jgi:hypothetical protein
MRPWLALIVVLATGCVATVKTGVDDPPDAGSNRPEVDGAPPAIDAPPDGSTFLASCMTKGYTAETGLTSLYRLNAAGDWPTAEATCVADVPGATHLVVLSSQAEVDFVKTRLGWVGLSDRATEDTFENVTKEPNDQRPFLSGQPDDGDNSEDCVQMKAGGLDDDQCDNAHAFLCECDGVPEAP